MIQTKVRSWQLLILICLVFTLSAHEVDWEYHEEFHIRQEASMRVFNMTDKTQFLGTIINSDYGQLDFYDHNRIKLSTNLEDSLYDSSNNILSYIQWNEDPELKKWFWERNCVFCPSKTLLVLFSSDGNPLITMDEQEDRGSFVFREFETEKPLAIAIWSWPLLGNRYIARLGRSVQNWDVFIIDRCFLEEKQISHHVLAWLLLKHSQRHFPSPVDYPFVKQP